MGEDYDFDFNFNQNQVVNKENEKRDDVDDIMYNYEPKEH